jgi:serine/threonine protein kinase
MRLLGKHPHVVQLVDSYEHDVADGGRSLGTEVYLLMELCSGGCLADLIKQRAGKPLPEKQMWSTFL